MIRPALVLAALFLATPTAAAPKPPAPAAIDAEVGRVMAATGAQGLAVAVIDGGQVRYVQAYGRRNAAGDPLTPDTIMYGASLTKAVFAWTVVTAGILFTVLKKTVGLRVSEQEELEGLDVHEHGSPGYANDTAGGLPA